MARTFFNKRQNRNNYYFIARKTNAQNTIPANTVTKVLYNVEDYDPMGMFDTSTSRMTAPIKGVYHINARFIVIATNTDAGCYLYKNGVEERRGFNGGGNYPAGFIHVDLLLNAGDYIEIMGINRNAGWDISATDPGYFNAHLVTEVT